MTLYLTDRDADPEEMLRARASGVVHAIKLYPAGATTNSAAGVQGLAGLAPVLEAMQACGLPLLVHGEVTDPTVDVFDREAVFLQRELAPLLGRLPGAARGARARHHEPTPSPSCARPGPQVAATITAHHLLLEPQRDVRGRAAAARVLPAGAEARASSRGPGGGGGQRGGRASSSARTAPRTRATAKEAGCGCAGIYTAHAAIELYAEAFAAAGAIDRLEGFACRFGPGFYGLPVNATRVRLVDEAWTVPASYPLGAEELIPMRAGTEIGWRLA
jgi:dihydroorotase